MSSLAKGGHRHLLMEMKSFMVNVGEDSVIFLSLYDSKQSEYIRFGSCLLCWISP